MGNFKITSLIIYSLLLLFYFSSFTAYAEKETPLLLVVPLDDRPANTYYPKKVGQAGGAQILLPPPELINHQTSFLTLDQLTKWILENGEKVDGFIISADMITDGGLVNSRLNKQTTEGMQKQLSIIKALKEKYPNKPLYVYDTIQRLAPTVQQDGNLEKYNLIRDWTITYDEVINLHATNKTEKLYQLETAIGHSFINDYLQTRARNKLINETLINWTKQGIIDFLILGQDDANKTGIHRKEQENLIKKINTYNIQNKVTILDGADEIDMILISRFLSILRNYQTSFKIHYLGVNGNNWTPPFDHYPLQTNIEKHVVASGGIIASPNQQANIELYVNTPDIDKKNEVTEAISEIKRQISSGKHVVFIDVEKVNQANAVYGDAVINKIGITNLLSYSAFNTAGNAVGTAIGHANSRYLYLEKGPHNHEVDETAAKGHIEFLLNSITSDYLYRDKIEAKIQWYVRYIGSNAWDISAHKQAVLNFTKEEFNKHINMLHENVKNNKILVSKKLGVPNTAEIESFSVEQIGLPWNRLFEVALEFQVNLKTSPREY